MKLREIQLPKSLLKKEGELQYLAIIEKGATSYGAYVPDLPGCVAIGETRTEVEKLIAEAIQFHIEDLREDDDDVPHPSSKAALVDVAMD